MKTIFHKDRGKAPRLMLFTIAFYQDCLSIMREDLLRDFEEVHNNMTKNQSTNSAFIMFVLKKKKESIIEVKEFSPINLVYNF